MLGGCATALSVDQMLVGEWARAVDGGEWHQYTLTAGGRGAYFECQGADRCDVQQDVFWQVEDGEIFLRQVLDFDHAVEISSKAALTVGDDGTFVLHVGNQRDEYWKQ